MAETKHETDRCEAFERTSARNRKVKSARAVARSTHFLQQAPTLFVEHEIAQSIKSADEHRLSSEWYEAALLKSQAAESYHRELKSGDEEAAALLCEAGDHAGKISFDAGQEYLKRSASIYCNCSNNIQAGRLRKSIAESYELAEVYDDAIQEYRTSLQYFRAGHAGLEVLEVQHFIADILITKGNYKEASRLYHEIGLSELNSNLTKGRKASKSFFRRVLLCLSMEECDVSLVKQYIKEIVSLDCIFQISASCDFLKSLTQILQQARSRSKKRSKLLDDFADHIFDFDKYNRLDRWDLDLLELFSKHHLEGSAHSESDE